MSPNAYLMDLSQFPENVNGDRGAGLHCEITVAQTNDQGNNAIFLHFPGGFTQVANLWNAEPITLRPNAFVRLELSRQDFFPMNGNGVKLWSGNTFYETDIWDYGVPSSFTMELDLHIMFTDVQVYWESHGFDSWDLLSFWGGGIFFFSMLHFFAFAIAKCFLPDDSKLLRKSAFEPIAQ